MLFTFHPISQYSLMIVHEVIFIAYVMRVKPYLPGTLSKQLTLLNEFCLLIQIGICGFFLLPDTLDGPTSNFMGNIFIMLIITTIASSWIAVFINIGKTIYRKL